MDTGSHSQVGIDAGGIRYLIDEHVIEIQEKFFSAVVEAAAACTFTDWLRSNRRQGRRRLPTVELKLVCTDRSRRR